MKIQIILNESSDESGITLTQAITLIIIFVGICGGWAFLTYSVTGR